MLRVADVSPVIIAGIFSLDGMAVSDSDAIRSARRQIIQLTMLGTLWTSSFKFLVNFPIVQQFCIFICYRDLLKLKTFNWGIGYFKTTLPKVSLFLFCQNWHGFVAIFELIENKNKGIFFSAFFRCIIQIIFRMCQNYQFGSI